MLINRYGLSWNGLGTSAADGRTIAGARLRVVGAERGGECSCLPVNNETAAGSLLAKAVDGGVATGWLMPLRISGRQPDRCGSRTVAQRRGEARRTEERWRNGATAAGLLLKAAPDGGCGRTAKGAARQRIRRLDAGYGCTVSGNISFFVRVSSDFFSL